DVPAVVMQGHATNLMLEPSLYRLLSPAMQSAWDQVRPQGTVDVSVNYSGSAPTTSPATTQPSGYEVILTPRNLAASPMSVPYQLDHLGGVVTVLPDRVILKDLTAKHGSAGVHLSGMGTGAGQQTWDFSLAAEDVPVDEDLRQALPASLADTLRSMQLAGKIN